MKNQPQNKYLNIAIYGLIVFVVGALFVMLLAGARDFFLNKEYLGIIQILNPFIYGAIFAYLLNPLLIIYENRVFNRVHGKHGDLHADAKLRRMLSLVATFISAAVLISLIALMVFPQIGVSVNQLAVKIADLFSPAVGAVVSDPLPPSESTSFLQDADLDALMSFSSYDALMNTKLGVYISEASAATQQFVSRFGLHVDIEQSLRELILNTTARATVFFGEYFQTIFNTTASFIVTAARQVLNILIGVIIAIYILADKEHLFSQMKRLLYALLPTEFVNKTIDITRKTHRIFGGFITGKLLDSLIIGVICFICMSVFKINYPMLISVIVGITNIIPFFGPFIGAVPSILFLIINDFSQGIWFAVFILILQQVDGNIIGPKILGSTIGLSSFWVIFSIIVVSGLLGPVGMFIGVPVFAVIYTLLKEFSMASLAKKGLPADREAYMDTAVKSEPVIDAASGKRFTRMVERWSKDIQTYINKMRRQDGDAGDDPRDDDDYYDVEP